MKYLKTYEEMGNFRNPKPLDVYVKNDEGAEYSLTNNLTYYVYTGKRGKTKILLILRKWGENYGINEYSIINTNELVYFSTLKDLLMEDENYKWYIELKNYLKPSQLEKLESDDELMDHIKTYEEGKKFNLF